MQGSSFFAIIRQSVIDQKRLRIPEELIQKYEDELSDIVKLSLPNGGEWGVHFKKAKKMAWFHDGLENFMKDNCIGINYFLLFKYARNSHFNVHVFDLTATEIDYPCNPCGACKRCEPVQGRSGSSEDCCSGDDGIDLSVFSPGDDGIDLSMFGPRVKQRKTTSARGQRIYRSYETRSKVRKLKEKSVILDGNEPGNPAGDCGRDSAYEEHIGDLHDQLAGSGDRNNISECHIPKSEEIADCKLVLQNPHFTVSMEEYQASGRSMYVAAIFARRLLPGNPRSVYLEDRNGKRWIVHCTLRTGRVSNMARGWRRFAQENELVAGNVCVFELIKDSPADKPVLKVHIFPSWEDLPQIRQH